MTALNHHDFLPSMMARHHQNDLPASSMYGYLPHDSNGLSSFSPQEQWTEQISWTPYQTVAGAQDFPYQTTVGQTYRQASQSGAGVLTNQNAHFEDFAQQAVSQYGSSNNSPAFSAADVASLHSEVSLESAQSSNLMNMSNNCSPSIHDMDGAYEPYGEFELDGAFHNGYSMCTGPVSPAAFSIAMSRGNSTMSNMQHFHHTPPTYTISPLDFPLFEDASYVQPKISQTSTTGKGGRRRNQPDSNNAARSHPFYHNAVVGPDGLYHCPWESDTHDRCSHKPEKLKCNYDKYIDSHLKPYKCKMDACSESSFSSTACLLRHEREAHAMHGHGEKPFNCELSTCDRFIQGNGFPRHWNLCDHMSRVHGIIAKPQENDKTTKGSRKRKSTTTAAAVKKPRASKLPKKEPISPPNSASSNEAQHFLEQKRRVLQAMEQLDPNTDPLAYEKLAKAGVYFRT